MPSTSELSISKYFWKNKIIMKILNLTLSSHVDILENLPIISYYVF